jgi:hypothetical protein
MLNWEIVAHVWMQIRDIILLAMHCRRWGRRLKESLKTLCFRLKTGAG